jgi:beta-lactamase class A
MLAQKHILILFLTLFQILAFSQNVDSLRVKIQNLVAIKNAKIGVAAWSGTDTLSINGNQLFPMMSVVKFHTALTVLHEVDKGVITLNQKVKILASDLDPNTHSSMRDKYSKNGFVITLAELLKFSISESDNIAFLKLVDLLGGIEKVQDYVNEKNVSNVHIGATYRDSFDKVLSNVSSPNAANTLLKMFCEGKLLKAKTTKYLLKIMTENNTGLNRIKGLLPNNTVVAHKTGTCGFDDTLGYGWAYNDIGIISLSKNKSIYLSVFITQSKESDENNALIIAQIAEMVFSYYQNK